MSNVMMKAASGVQSQILKDGSVIAVDANGFLAVPQDFVTDCLRAGHALVSAMSALPAVQYKTRATTTTGAIHPSGARLQVGTCVCSPCRGHGSAPQGPPA